eukprot:6080429-Amphidinium_carterae.1
MFAIIAAEMQLATGSSSADAPKRLATSERVGRKKRQQGRLAGLSIRGNWEPSDSLVDLCVAMHDENRAKWLPWSKLTKQQQEITADRSDPTLVRRGLALDQAGLCNYQTHASWVEELFEHRLRSSPAGVSRVLLEQLQEADKTLWHKLSELCSDGIRAKPHGSSPLEAGIKQLMYHAELQTRLVPVPSTSYQGSGSAPSHMPPPASGQKKRPASQQAARQPKGKGESRGRLRCLMPYAAGSPPCRIGRPSASLSTLARALLSLVATPCGAKMGPMFAVRRTVVRTASFRSTAESIIGGLSRRALSQLLRSDSQAGMRRRMKGVLFSKSPRGLHS